MVEKLTHNTRLNLLADAHEQDVSWIHVYIGFGCLVFHEALRAKEKGYQPAIARGRKVQTFKIPVPCEAQRKENHLFQRIQFERESQQWLRKAHAAPVRTFLDGHLVHILQLSPPFIARGQSHLADDLSGCRVGQGKRAVRAFGDREQEFVLALWQPGKGCETTIRLEMLDQR